MVHVHISSNESILSRRRRRRRDVIIQKRCIYEPNRDLLLSARTVEFYAATWHTGVQNFSVRANKR